MTETTILEKIISERRSVKPALLNGKKIENKQIEQLLSMADWAPTHGHTEPWRFVVMQDKAVMRFCQDHAEMYKSSATEDSFLKSKYEKLITNGEKASHIVAVFNKRGNKANITVLEEICATAAAVQNILLAAETMNIAALWSTGGMTMQQEMKQYFNLLEEDTMIGLLYLGYTDEPKKQGKRITPIEEKVAWRNS